MVELQRASNLGQKRLSYGLSFLASYTWSKTLTNADSIFSEFTGFTQDPITNKPEKALGYQRLSHKTLSFPISMNYPLAQERNGRVQWRSNGQNFGGWSVAGIQQYQSGSPSRLSQEAP